MGDGTLPCFNGRTLPCLAKQRGGRTRDGALPSLTEGEGVAAGALPSLTEGGGSSSGRTATHGAERDDKFVVTTVMSSDRGGGTADGTGNWIPSLGTPQVLGLTD